MRFLHDADDVLRGRPWVLQRQPTTIRRLVVLIAVFGMAYGGVMGTFGLLTFQELGYARLWQVAYSAVKVPMLLSATFAICLPSFFVVNTLLGLRTDFAEALRALVASQAAIAIVLVSLAPFTLFWYLSHSDYEHAIVFNIVVFGLASLTGQVLMRRSYVGLIRRNLLHRRLLMVWMFLYAFVGIQMGWVLRPFIGSADRAVEFFRPEAWDNAYLYVLSLILRSVLGA